MESHKTRLLEYLRKNGGITSMEAIMKLGNTRLSATIYTLRKEGYNIVNEHLVDKNRYGETTHFDRFVLKEE